MISRPLRHALIYILVAILGTLSLVALIYWDRGADQRHERIDTLTTGPFLVMRVNDGFPAFWGFVIDIRTPKINAKPKQGWTHDLRFAWRFESMESASESAQKVGGVAVLLRVIL